MLEQLNVFAKEDIDTAAAQGEQGGDSEAIYAGEEKIRISHFYDCLQDIVWY